jgi:GH24 family phage-related lysozyme (muramidase)
MSGGYENLHPVFAERLHAMNEVCGTSIYSGWRSSQRQQELYNGYVQGIPGYNPANPPGTSNHEACPWGDPMALAVDLQGDLALANARAAEFGLHFPIANVEPWHCQPVEVTYAYYTGAPAEWGHLGRGILAVGAQGRDVVECQQRLNAHGFECQADGDFGPVTEATVAAFQNARDLISDSIVGPTTWGALDREPEQPHPAPVPAPATSTGRRTTGELRLSSQGASLLANFEGRSNVLYNDPAGHCTIGIGHLVHEGPICGCDAETPFMDGLTDEQCYQLFLEMDVPRYEQPVREYVTVPLFPSEFDALISFTYNVGASAFGDSTLLRLLNMGPSPAGRDWKASHGGEPMRPDTSARSGAPQHLRHLHRSITPRGRPTISTSAT